MRQTDEITSDDQNGRVKAQYLKQKDLYLPSFFTIFASLFQEDSAFSKEQEKVLLRSNQSKRFRYRQKIYLHLILRSEKLFDDESSSRPLAKGGVETVFWL